MKTIAKLILANALIIFSTLIVQAQLTELVAKKEKAIFAVYTYDEYGSPSGMGTGFFIDGKGTGITNFHVLDGASKAIIKLSDNSNYDITKILASNQEADLVRFSIDNPTNKSFSYLTLSQTVPLKGQKIFVIGNPEGLQSSVSEGIVSSIRELEGFGNIIQITAPISPGSSGSPIMTMEGNVVAVATFQFKEGQNLNFGIESDKIKDLLEKTNSKSISNLSNDLVIVNQKCEENTELVLNSIDFQSDKTVINFSFTNVSMGYGKRMMIWTARGKGDEGFFIQDLESKIKYYLTSASIASGRENGTEVNLGETKRFTVTFEKVPTSVKKINVMEGLSSSWAFLNIDLENYRKKSGKDVSNYQKNLALTKLTTSDYTSAKEILNEKLNGDKTDDEAFNILGIISYVMDNNFDALNYFSKAIEINSKNDIYYFNRFTVYASQRKISEALMDITLAIKCRPTQGDYYYRRAGIYAADKNYEKAVADMDVAISQMGEDATLYKLRGNYKTWLNDFNGACSDWNKSYKLSDRSDDELHETIRKNCK